MNPFDIVSAELMDLPTVGNQFVSNNTEHTKLAAFTHTLVWGSRGSGKSIHFRFLEPVAQANRPDSEYAGDVSAFIAGSAAFVGVYINCREGVLNKEEFKQASHLPNVDPAHLQILIDRHLAAEILRCVSRTLRTQLTWLGATSIDESSLPHALQDAITVESNTIGGVLNAVDRYAASVMHAVSVTVDNLFLGNTGLNDSELGSLRTSPGIREFCEWLQATCDMACPFFLLFDEANELSREQQACINGLISVRSQRTLCIKVASQLHGFTPHRSSGDSVDETHDYTTLDLESLYTNHQQAYYERVRTIAEERLTRAGISGTIEEYLPANPKDLEFRENARRLASERYDAMPVESRPKDKENFLKKYAPAIVFQELRSAKAGRSYAGFDNVVHLSSGIVRAFLDCCSRMYSRYVESHPGDEPVKIPIGIQNEVIGDYSDDFIKMQLLSKIEGLPDESRDRQLLEELHNLLNGLGAFYRDRLMDKDSREPRIISVSLKEKPSKRLGAVLTLAEREAFMHRKWYRSKRGNRNLPCYVLNRRLCPHFNLDLSGFQGRVEFAPEQLEVALTSPDEFVASVRRERPTDDRQMSLFEISEW